MKKITMLMSAAGLAFVAMNAAHAADGTITFTGSISSQTCTINGNGSGAKDFTVALPTVSTGSLAAAGQTAGQTPFSITLSKCSAATGNVHTFFEAGATTDLTTGNLIVASGTGSATNVQIGLLNSDLTPIKAGAADASQNSKSVAIVDNAATLQYYARYVATGAATSGAANTTVMYTLAYQ